jgi:hypothetical protein
MTVDILPQQEFRGSRLHHLDIIRRFSTTKEFPFQQAPRVSDPPTRLCLRLYPPALCISRLLVLWYKLRALKSTTCPSQEIHSVLPDMLGRVATHQIRQLRHHGCLPRRDIRYLNVYLRIDEKRFHIRHTNLEDR